MAENENSTNTSGIPEIEINVTQPSAQSIDIGITQPTPQSATFALSAGTTVQAPVDPTLTLRGKAADAKVTGDAISGIVTNVTALQTSDSAKVNKPETNPNGTSGQLLRTNGDGTTQWVDEGLPTDEQTAEAVSDWLDAHAATSAYVMTVSGHKLVFTEPESGDDQ